MRYIYYYNLHVLSNVIVIKAKGLLPRAYMYVILADFNYPVKALLSVSDEGYFRNASCGLNLISMFFFAYQNNSILIFV